MALAKPLRLRRSADVRRVLEQGGSRARPLAVLYWRSRGDAGPSRFAFIASRRIGGAVQRNRARRRLAGAVQAVSDRLRPGWDGVVIARRPCLQADVAALREELRGLLEQAGMLADG